MILKMSLHIRLDLRGTSGTRGAGGRYVLVGERTGAAGMKERFRCTVGVQ